MHCGKGENNKTSLVNNNLYLKCIQDNTFKEGNRHWIQNFSWIGVAKILFNLFCYPLWLIVL